MTKANLQVHQDSQKQTKFDPQIDYRTPVLLHQGFGFTAAAVGLSATSTNQISTGRGTVKYLDIYPFFFGSSQFDVDVPVTISAGGQVLLEDANLGIYSFDAQLGKDKHHRIRVMLNDAQQFDVTINNINGSFIQAVAPHFYYTTPAYEHFLKNVFQLKWSLALKRRVYRLALPDGAPVDDFIERVLPRNNGDIIAVGVHSSSTPTDLRNILYDVSIDGVTQIQDIFGLQASTANGRDGYMMPIPIRPGATMRFRGSGDLTVSVDPVVLYITFFFGS